MFDEEDRPLPPGERGEIVCRGPQTMAYYWNNPEATAEAFRNGWLHTGDIGYMDADGFFYLVDRKNDMLISGGYNVYPREVEDVLLACEGVVEAAVVGLPDEKWGDRVYAVVSGRAAVWLRTRDGARARATRQLQAAEGRRDLAGAAEELRQQDPPPRGPRQTCSHAAAERDRQPQPGASTVNETHLVMHGLAIKKHATPEDSRRHSRSRCRTTCATALGKLVEAKRAVEAQGSICWRRPRAWRSRPTIRVSMTTLRANPGFQAGYDGIRAPQRRAQATDHRMADDRGARRARPQRSWRQGLRRQDHRPSRRTARARRRRARPARERPAAHGDLRREALGRRWKRPRTARSSGSATPRSKAITRCGSSCTKICCA